MDHTYPRGRPRNQEDLSLNFIFPDLQEVHHNLFSAGIPCSDINDAGGGYFSFDVSHNNRKALTVKGKGRGDYIFVTEILANPIRYTRWRDFWRVLEAMHEGNVEDNTHLIINRGHITRIDYACDYCVPIVDIMRGLYVDNAISLTAYNDLENPYISRSWERGQFSSFVIGRKPRVIKIYDKLLEQRNRRGARNNNLDDAWSDTPTARPRQIVDDVPWTRIEISLYGQSRIADRWNSFIEGYNAPHHYTGMLSELPNHVSELASAMNCPFEGILLNHIKMRSTRLSKNLEAQRIRHEVELGLLMNVYLRMRHEGNFWEDHLDKFSIYPWHKSYQPTNIYYDRTYCWFRPQSGLTFRASSIPSPVHMSQQTMEAWRVDLTRNEVFVRLRNARRIPNRDSN